FQVVATDSGTPSLSSNVTVNVFILDQNDNAPVILYPVSSNGSAEGVEEIPLNVNAGHLFQVVATDSGTPSLSSNVTVNVFILDQNDNAPVILYPVSSNGSAEGVEEIPLNVNAGHLVTKVRAYDADIGYNGWLLFSLQEVTDHSLFGLDRYTGQIRTLRSFTETDEAEHKLLILVKDNGNVSLSATATVTVKLVEPKEAFAASDVKSAAKVDEDDNVTFYLMITLGSVSVLFIISIIRKVETVVGDVAKDLGLDKSSLKDRHFRIVSGSTESLFMVNQNDGTLFVNRKVDREEVCGRSSACLINLKTVLENPLEIHYVAVEVTDVNDHSPAFSENETNLEISESAVPGARFQLQAARDADSGQFSIQQYKLSHSEHFRIEVKDRGEDRKIPFLVIQRQLDRETAVKHKLLLTAVDGGKPAKSGTIEINVEVLDVNDNSPVFAKDIYSVTLRENTPVGAIVTQINATDLDEGSNGEVLYLFGKEVESHIMDLFGLNQETGEITVKGKIDFEENQAFEIDIRASDKGSAPLTTDKSIFIKVVDVNDNAPEIEVTSFSDTIPEDSRIGTTVALISVNDLDSGHNGKVICFLNDNPPFALVTSMQDRMYSVVTKASLDRENQFQYDVRIFCKDTASSTDLETNGYMLVGPRMSIGSTIVPGSHANTLVLPDRRRASGEFQVVATDSGTPSLSSNVTVNVFILDQNDNAPVILYPVSSNGSAEGVEEIPRNVNAGHLVTKVRAYDADIGYNGWLLFSLQEVTDHSLFGLDRYTGQIRTLRPFTETDEAEHKLLILVKDNGNVSLSATATVTVKLVEPKEAFAASDVKSAAKVDEDDNVTFYLMITLGSVSVLFIISIIVLIAMQCSKSTDYTSKYLQETNYDGTLCHSIQYRSGDKRIHFQVVATDSGTPSLSSNVTVNVFILDQNDNAPVILYPVSSNGSAEGVEEIPRNVNAGHLVTKVRAYDADIGYNGWLLFSLQEVTDHSLFGLDRYTGQIRTLRSFTETDEAEHKLLILVKDNGNVSLSATATVIVKLVEPKEAFAASDVKSAAKVDEDDNVTFYLMITLGSVSVLFIISIIVLIAMQCSKSTDYSSKYLQETNYDGTLCHSIQYRSGDKRYMLVGPRMSIGSTIVPGSHANTLVLPDRRRASGEFQVVATDSGTPSLSSNVTVNVFILDQNDNAPVILYPVSSNGSAEGVEEIPSRNVNAGHLVTKVRAYDADIGYNGWLLFSLQEVTDHSLFGLDRYTGQIRTLRSFTETDEAEHKLLILVKDNGNVSLSATATVTVKLVEPKEGFCSF
ncbi:hypothetical protein L3Q82_020584, partial [Scortum barcoo]